MPFILELEDGVFFAPGPGEPATTLIIDNAKLFRGIAAVKNGLDQAQRFRPFPSAAIIPVRVKIRRA